MRQKKEQQQKEQQQELDIINQADNIEEYISKLRSEMDSLQPEAEPQTTR